MDEDNIPDCCRVLSKPLHGYSFYIDVENGEAVDILVGKISSLGGNVRHILSHRILYFVTTGKSNQRLQIRRSARFMKQNETRAQKRICSVPFSNNEETLMSTVDRARKLGLNIFTIGKVTKWLKQIERRRLRVSPISTTKKKPNVDQSQLFLNNDEDKYVNALESTQSLSQHENNDEELQTPFIKVEDKGKVYAPQYLELGTFPSISFESTIPRSPFQNLHLNTTMSGVNTSDTVTSTSESINKTASSSSNYSKSGYCDFCESFFRYRDMHIRSTKHQRNIPYENFKKLDELIQKGVQFDHFLKTMAEKKIARDLINTMEERKKLSAFLRTMEGKKKARDFFRDARKGQHDGGKTLR